MGHRREFIPRLCVGKAYIRFVFAALSFFFIFSLMTPVRLNAAPTFTTQLQNRFVQAILEFAEPPYEFNRYALHDFDGDGVPELLMGWANRINPLFVDYVVMKYDILGDRFVTIGGIAESRYLMRDRYSYALIGYYQGIVNGYDFKIYKNYYIANGNLSRNTPLAMLEGQNNVAVYDGANVPSGYFKNDIEVPRDLFDQEELIYRGSYDEVIVHDKFGFTSEVATIAVRSWKPAVINKRPVVFTSGDVFTKTWQLPMYELIKAKLGPASTNIEEFAINQVILKDWYQRFALYDIDGDGVPELFLGVQRGEKFSFDVYRYWNNDMHFVGSFDGYGKYIAKMPGGVFAYNPVPNEFHRQSANKITFPSNSVKNDTLLMVYDQEGKMLYRAPDSRGVNLTSLTYAKYLDSLVNYVVKNPEIKTFDIEMVPPSAALIMYLKTNSFTMQ